MKERQIFEGKKKKKGYALRTPLLMQQILEIFAISDFYWYEKLRYYCYYQFYLFNISYFELFFSSEIIC